MRTQIDFPTGDWKNDCAEDNLCSIFRALSADTRTPIRGKILLRQVKDSIEKSNLQLEFLISSTNSYPRKQVKSIGGLKP
ncbi:MAG: hypothetical protein CMA09_04960 [Euryarchaeota archaeon]|nr:hypothetical protein [Euryarchaeota archaeon]